MDTDNTVDTSVQTETTSGLVDSLLSDQSAAQEPPAQETQPSAEDARKAELNSGLNELLEDGWTVEEIQALVLDEQMRADIKAGKSLMRAVNAYERRQKAQDTQASAKRGVQNLRNASAAGGGEVNRIAEMSDAEFDKFYKKAKSDALAGVKIRL